MNYWLLFVSQVVLVLTLVYFYTKRKYNYWSSRGIPGPQPVPLLGNLLEMMRRGQIVTELEWAQKYGKMYGTYTGSQPILAITDPELIKQVMIKDFPLFMNRRKVVSTEESAQKSLFNLEGEAWKRVRTITSPSFTSGKLRGMNLLMHHCIDKLAAYLQNVSTQGDGVINTKEVVAGFTIDVIASTSFATETDTNNVDRSKKSPFIEHGFNLFKVDKFRLMMQLFMPFFVRKIVFKYFAPLENFTFFKDLAVQVVKQRRDGVVKRNDFVQLLMDAYVEENELQKEGYDQLTASDDKDEKANESETNKSNAKSKNRLDDIEIIAQMILFFLAGFETTASAISHTIFHLARDQEIQERLLRDIRQATDGLDITSAAYYDTVMTKIPYLDAVIKETLRLYPPLVRLERRVGVDGYKLGDLTLEKEQLISICAYAVHRSPENYPDPERYDPERFMPENRSKLVPYAWMPFGQGPRNCVGMRFAYQEIKLCLAKILPQFQFTPTNSTPEKLAFEKMGLLVVKPFKLKVTQRK